MLLGTGGSEHLHETRYMPQQPIQRLPPGSLVRQRPVLLCSGSLSELHTRSNFTCAGTPKARCAACAPVYSSLWL